MEKSTSEYTLVEVPPYKPEKIPDIDHVMECCDNIAEIARGFNYTTCMEILGNLGEIAAALGRDNDEQK